MYPSGTVVTFGELEARANRLAHYFRSAGLVEGDAVAILMENNEHFHAVMWAARARALLRPDQHAPHRGRGRLHHRQQQRQGDRRLRGAAQARCEGLAEQLPQRPARRAADRRRRPRRLAALPGMRCRPTRYADRRRDRGRPAAVLVGHDRPAEGHQARTAAPAAGRGARADVGAGRVLDATPRRSTSARRRCTTPRRRSGRCRCRRAGITTVVLEKFDAEGCLDAIQQYR